MENNDELRKLMAKKALPTREFYNVSVGGGYSKLCLALRRRL